MPDLLFLTQRIPYPPIKGEKIRPLQILRHLRERFDVHLGCLVDDPADQQHEPTVAALCATSHFARLDRRRAKLACLSGLLTGEGLSVTFYRDRGLQDWVRRTLAERRPDAIFVCSSNMAPYVLGRMDGVPHTLCDLADVDSEKWRAYAQDTRESAPMRWVHRREWGKVAALEARIARDFAWSTFVSEPEAELFREHNPSQAGRIAAVPSGVDTDYFDPAGHYDPPYPTDRPNYVFTGTMDYPPNIDAARWFATEILPIIQRQHPAAAFHVVGSSPAPAVTALASPCVTVTGRVPDVRPWVAHATAAVAPMRIARGIQNKVLEGMAMGRPVVVTADALTGVEAEAGHELLLGEGAEDFAARCLDALVSEAAAIGSAARARALRDYGWAGRLRGFDRLLGVAA